MATYKQTQYDTPIGVGGQINTNTGMVTSGSFAGMRAADSQTISNFQQANPGLRAVAEDYARMAITPDSLTPTKPANVPKPPTNTDPAPLIAGGNAVLGANASTLGAGQNGDLASILKNLYPEQQQSNAGLYASQYKESIAPLQGDVNVAAQNTLAAQQRLAGVNARITGITARAQQMNLQQEGRHAQMAQISGQQAENNRKAAIEALPLQVEALTAQAEVAAAQGQQELSQQILSQAQTHLDTVFSIQMKDAENAFNYKKDLFNTVFTYANEQQKNQLQVALKEAEFAQQEKMAKINNDFAEQRVRLEASLRQKESSKRDTQVVDGKLIDMQTGEIISDLNNPTSNALGNALAAAKVDNINNILNSSALDSAVGPSGLARTDPGLWAAAKRFFTGALVGGIGGAGAGALVGGVGAIPGAIIGALTTGVVNSLRGSKDELTGDRQNFIAATEQMRSDLTVDKLSQAKGQGVTFGALSDGERMMVANAATKIGTWAVHVDGDKNKPVLGYNIDQKSFKREMDVINYFVKLDAILKGATPESVGAVTNPDGSIWMINSDGTLSELRRK